MNTRRPPDLSVRQRGVALVIVLSFVALLTVVVVAYFSRVMNSRQLANDSANASKTDQLARSALDGIVADFKQEIANGSTTLTVPPSNGVTTYYPTIKSDGTIVRANMVPQRSGTSDSIPNLIRRSVRRNDGPTDLNPMPAPGIPSRASAINSAGDPAAGGRVVSNARWNKHYLIPPADGTGSKPDPVAAFVAPDWVMMTKEKGPSVLSAPTKDKDGNAVTVVGRYSYAVYDEGGLLDANVAGFPTGLAPEKIGGKSALALADLTQLPISANPSPYPSSDYLSQISVIDQIVGWRNYATAHPGGTFGGFSFDGSSAKLYYDAVTADLAGGLSTNANYYQNLTDQRFLSRGQLLAFQQKIQQSKPGAFPASALQYLGTFSRELNAPSWGPTQNATDIDPQNGSGSYAYRDNRSGTYRYNRLLTEVRYNASGTVTSYHADGTPYTYTVKKGDPLVQRRFPLSRLAWIGPNGPNAAVFAPSLSDADRRKAISDCFGLTGGTNGWTYTVSPDASDPALTSDPLASIIRKLGSVANEIAPREPNFFELLQAGILSGSLGLSPQQPLDSTGDSYLTRYQAWIDLNVFRIGASILTQIQQATGTSAKYYPIVIQYARSGTNITAIGVDDLPYFSMFHMLAGKDPSPTKTDLNLYLMFGLWNPHQILSGSSSRPSVRVRAEGTITVENNYGNYPAGSVVVYNTWKAPGYAINIGATAQLSDAAGVGVNGFADPRSLRPQDLQATPGTGDSTGKVWASLPAFRDGSVWAGYRLPDFLIDTTKRPPTPADINAYDSYLWPNLYLWVNTNTLSPFNCWLEYLGPDNATWIPYTYHAGIEHGFPNLTQFSKQPGFYSAYLGREYPPNTRQGDVGPGSPPAPAPPNPIGNPPAPLGIDPVNAPEFFYYIRYPWGNTDPRTLRFNYTQQQTPNNSTDNLKYLSTSIWGPLTEAYNAPGTNPLLPAIGRPSGQNIPTLFIPPSAPISWASAGLARNNNSVALPPNSSSAGAYFDSDGIRRVADSGLYVDTPNTANSWAGDPYALADADGKYPTFPHRVSDRPIILHRPLNNVAELGYVSRDYPWRTLDFFSDRSADAGLLDIFTVSQSAGPMSAGRINLNTRNTTALNAVLSQSVTDVLRSPLPTLSKPQGVAAKLVALTSSTISPDGPLINKDEIVTRFVGKKLTAGSFSSNVSDFASADDQNLKPRREAVTRALSEVGQTRTWNLLVDVVAQSGRYGSSATSLAQFNIEGERHYWLHVAIDRFTGEVIDQQIEPVSE